MIYREHFIELWVNGNKVELEDQKSLGMRFNNVLFDPTKVSSSQAEYSFEFEVPATPHNNKIFDYANNLSKENKFHQRYNAKVYCDGGVVIFSGSIIINGVKDNKYKLNLVSVKVYSLEEIFGDMTMNQIKDWKITFNGVETINTFNSILNPQAVFPLVSYGVFQKDPYNSDEVANDFTSKYDIDEWNRWYLQDFFPSHNMLTTLKKCFGSVKTPSGDDYVVGGDVFEDQFLSDVYMSINLADGQDPDYNVGNPRFGHVDISTTFSTSGQSVGYQQELNFPYFVVSTKPMGDGTDTTSEYNFNTVNLFNMLSSGGTVTSNQSPCYMYQPDENCIIVPADGFYKIEMSATTTLNTTGSIVAAQYTRNFYGDEVNEEDIELTPGLQEITPIEIQLLRNYDDNLELIKGKNNVSYRDGNPTHTIAWEGEGITPSLYANKNEWLTCYPHEDPYASKLPTKENDLKTRNSQSRLGGNRSQSSGSGNYSSGNDDTSASGNFSGRRGGTRGGTIDPTGGGRNWSSRDYGYIYGDNEIMCYDQAVSEAFICGFSSMGGGVVSVMKNGYSWSPITATKNEVFAPVIGYYNIYNEQGTSALTSAHTEYNSNTYINTPISRISVTNTSMNGYVSCIVRLNKNDVLSLMAVQREYHTEIGNDVTYNTTSNVNLKITAFSPNSYYSILEKHNNRYEAPVEFDERLNLANFFNRETKISDWINNVVDAFNLEVIQNGNVIDINRKKKISNNVTSVIDIDDRVNSAEAESEMISYPKSMAVKYKIDTDEWGFERSAVENAGGDETILDEDDWKKYADSGYTNILLNDDSYVTSTSDKSLQFSYTWYQNFNWYAVNSAFTKTSDTAVPIKIPCISKYTYMIDGYDYVESMKHDGYGLPQRFWFRPKATNCYVWTRTYPVERVMIYEPTNMYTNYQDVYFNLSYKNTEESILTNYFNTKAYLASNYIELEVYLSAEEYNRIKNGTLVHFDSDLYIPVEIQAYDPTGFNPTTLKLMKKVI